MKLLKKALVMGTAMLVALPSIASAADIVGFFTNVEDDVFIERNGERLRVTNNSAIMSGDKLIAWNNGSATVKMNSGCDARLPQNTFIQLGMGNHCSAIGNASGYQGDPTQVADGTYTKTVAGPGGAGGATAGGGLLAIAGAGGIVGFARNRDKGKTTPTSP